MPVARLMNRRSFLKGTGVALLLPRMESLGQVAEADSPRRLLTIVNHLSFYQPHEHRSQSACQGQKAPDARPG